MQLRISSPEKIVYEWDISEITLPTEIWELKIVPWNTPMVTAVKPWILTFLSGTKKTTISIWKWMVFADSKIVRIATSSATTGKVDKNILEKKKAELESKLKKLSTNGSIEEIENLQNQLSKINADLKLNK